MVSAAVAMVTGVAAATVAVIESVTVIVTIKINRLYMKRKQILRR